MSNNITSYDRVKRAINFKNPDRIPIMHAILPGAWLKYGDKLYDIIKKYPSDLTTNEILLSSTRSASCVYDSGEITKKYKISDDFSIIEPRHFMYGPLVSKGQQQDEWGCI